MLCVHGIVRATGGIAMFILNEEDTEYLSRGISLMVRVVINALTAVFALTYLFSVGMIGVAWLALLAMLGYDLSVRGRHCAWFTYHWLGKPIFAITGIRIRYQNADVLVQNEPYVVVANHASAFDVVALLIVPDFIFVSKYVVKWWPPIGWMGILSKQIFIRREERGNLSRVKEGIAKRPRSNLLVFPEATRSSNGILADFRSGAAQIAFDLKRCIIPVSILGTNGLLGDGVFNFLATYRRGRVVEVIFDNPVSSLDDVATTTAKVRCIIASHLGQQED